MGIKLSELEEGFHVTLKISNENSDSDLEIGAIIKGIIKEDIALIELEYDSTKRLNFDNVKVDMEYYQDENVPILWRNVRIASYKTGYALQAPTEGVRHNRRGCFRVGVSTLATMRMTGRGASKVMIKDVSLSGFSITDRKKELALREGDKLGVSFEDIGHIINLTGIVVRVEKHEDMDIYGIEICNLCKDLSSYISIKQRHKR